ncbi:MAG TPA: hypothetical protein VGG33_09065, partial [Polyangia bacterium]
MANPTTPAAVPQPVKPLRVALFIGAPALLAVVAVVWALRRPQASDLPVYAVETPGLGEPLTLLVGGSAEVILRPATAVNAPVAAAAFWLRNGQAEQWHAVTAVSAEGTVAFQGPIDSGNRGLEGELAFVVT